MGHRFEGIKINGVRKKRRKACKIPKRSFSDYWINYQKGKNLRKFSLSSLFKEELH
jgi:hypothetical protein